MARVVVHTSWSTVPADAWDALVGGRSPFLEHFFLLDCSVPAAVKLWRSGERRFAVRWSEYEPLEGVLAWAGKADWCWVDCFRSFPSDQQAWAQVAEHFAICLVSPELQGHAGSTLSALRAQVAGRDFSAVCTKRPELWQERA